MSTPSQRFAAAATRLTALVRDVPPQGWSAPSPCEGWSAADVLAHVVETEGDFLARHGLPAGHTDGLEPIAAWAVRRDAVQAALDDAEVASTAFDGYFGPTTIGETIDRFYTMDLVVHRWDIATACALPQHAVLYDDEIATVRASLAGLEGAMRTPGLFGPEVSVGPHADAQTALLAYIGRAAGAEASPHS